MSIFALEAPFQRGTYWWVKRRLVISMALLAPTMDWMSITPQSEAEWPCPSDETDLVGVWLKEPHI